MRSVIRRKLAIAAQRPATPAATIAIVDEPKFSADQAAEKLGISPSTVLKRFGRTPGVIRIGRGRRQIIRFPESVLRRILEASTVR